MYDEDDLEDSIIVIDFDWKPAPESLNLQDEDFAKKITERLKGITIESFEKEVGLWQQAISSLPNYDEVEIRKEISQWNIGIPRKDDFDFETYSIFYSLQVNYRNRIAEITNVVFAHNEMLTQAQKNLKEIAARLATGTAVDKTAIASYTVNQFSIALSHSKRLLTYLENVTKNIDFAAQQMERMLREKQTLARINTSFLQEGVSNFITRDKIPTSRTKDDSAIIKTQNRFLK